MTLHDIDPELVALLEACWWSCNFRGWEARPCEAVVVGVSNVLLWWK